MQTITKHHCTKNKIKKGQKERMVFKNIMSYVKKN